MGITAVAAPKLKSQVLFKQISRELCPPMNMVNKVYNMCLQLRDPPVFIIITKQVTDELFKTWPPLLKSWGFQRFS